MAAVVVLAGGAVGSAFGVGGRLRDLIAGKPAPPRIAARLVDEATAERITPLFGDVPNADVERAHGVLAVDTSGGPVALWTVPTRDGPICYLVEIVRLSEREDAPHGDSRCLAHPSPGAPVIWTRTKELVEGRQLRVLAGPVDPVVASVWLRSPEGALHRAATAENFFLVEIPDGKGPYQLVVRDVAGRELQAVAITDFTANVFDSFARKVTGPARTVIETADSRGRPLRLLLQPAEGGDMCLIIESAGRGSSCGPPDQLRTAAGISVYPALAGSIVYLEGSVGPDVARLTLRYQDGQEVDVPIVERFVLFDIPRARFREGKRPLELVGRNAHGDEVARRRVGQGVFGPKSSIWLPGEVSP